MSPVRYEDALASSRQTLLLQRSQFLEEAGNVHDGTGANQIDAFRGDEARRQDVEVVGHVVVHDRVSGIFLTPTTSAVSAFLAVMANCNVFGLGYMTYCDHPQHDSTA